MMIAPITLVVLLFAQRAAASCTDGKDNVVKLGNIGNGNPITFNDVTIGTYDSSGKAACNNGEGSVQIPGQLKLLSGNIKVSKALKIVNNSVLLMSIESKYSWIGKVCVNGTSKYSSVSDKDCRPDLCEHSKELCKLLEKVGDYKVSDLKAKGVNTTIVISSLPKEVPAKLAKGRWRGSAKLWIGKEQVGFNAKVPSGDGWIVVKA